MIRIFFAIVCMVSFIFMMISSFKFGITPETIFLILNTGIFLSLWKVTDLEEEVKNLKGKIK